MDQPITLAVRDYSTTPGSRFQWEGEFSGEDFRDTVLRQKYEEAVRRGVKLVVDLDGTAGYASSFLEEAFGGLVRQRYADKKKLLEILEVVSNDRPRWRTKVFDYIRDAEPK